MIAVHLPDGAIREVPSGTTPLEIANSISPRLAAASIAARIAPVATVAVQSAAARNNPTVSRPTKRQCTPPKTLPRRASSISPRR